MGWASGSELANDVWQLVRSYIPEATQQKVAQEIVEAFENHDADDWGYEDDDVYYVAYPERKEVE